MTRFLLIIFFLSSCSATHHLNKFYKKGGKIEQVEKTVTLYDTIQGVNGKDSIVIREVKAICPEPRIETRYKVRFNYKRFKDSLNIVRIQYKDSLRSALRSQRNALRNEYKTQNSNNKVEKVKTRQENKRSLWWLWYCLGAATIIVGKILIKMYLPLKK